jgi:hypothetical protein
MLKIQTCKCGCGQPVKTAIRTRPDRGWIKGHPLKYLHGHNRQVSPKEERAGFKFCSCCGEEKPRSEFHKHSGHSSGLQSVCKCCNKAKHAVWRKANKGKDAWYAFKWRLRTKFKITLENYLEMLKNQGGACAICDRKVDDRRMAVDHDHKTGKIRGLLCIGCNFILGSAKDSVPVLEAAIGYLKRNFSVDTRPVS